MTFNDLEEMTFSEIESYSFFQLESLISIYDRVQSDVDNKTSKGLMNYSDLNRIELNIKSIADEIGVSFSKVTWAVNSIPKESDFARWKTALDSIKSAYNTLLDVPLRPFNTFTKWNELEYLLWYTDKIFNENRYGQSYCGEFYCGELGII